MSLTGSSYPISRSTGQCSATGAALAIGQPYIAVLVEREVLPATAATGMVLERLDYSMEAWDSGKRPPQRLFAHWKSHYSEAVPTKKPLLGDDELIDLFEQLAEATEHKQLAFRYVLALLLIRRRLLRMMGNKPKKGDDPAYMLVLPKGSSGETPPLPVIDPGLDDAAISEVIEQVGQIIATGE